MTHCSSYLHSLVLRLQLSAILPDLEYILSSQFYVKNVYISTIYSLKKLAKNMLFVNFTRLLFTIM